MVKPLHLFIAWIVALFFHPIDAWLMGADVERWSPITLFRGGRKRDRGSCSTALLPSATAAWKPPTHPPHHRRRGDFASSGEEKNATSLEWVVELSTDTIDDWSSSSSDRDLSFRGVGRLYATTASIAKEPTRLSSSSDLFLDRLQRATVMVVGVGGVGSWAAEALGRSGVGNLVLVDFDDICRSNLNRQVHALRSTVGRMKVDVLQERLADISPCCNVACVQDFVTSDNVHEVLDQVQKSGTESDRRRRSSSSPAVVVLDAMDGSTDKAALVAACAKRRIPIVVCGGAAGRTDPTSIIATDLTRAQDDRLLMAVRRTLRRHHGFPEGAAFRKKQPKPWRIMAVHSTQKEPSSQQSSSLSSSSLRRCDADLGTACFVTGTFGFVAAGCVVDMIANDRYKIPSLRL
jgi:tRNA A37 threonylcarbamoyladenosine dehydratase